MVSQKKIDIKQNLLGKLIVAVAIIAGICGGLNERYSSTRFLAHVQSRIRYEWHPPGIDRTRQAVVSFFIEQSGIASDLRVVNSSGNRAFDDAALSAVKGVIIFDLPPGEFDHGVRIFQQFDARPKPPFSFSQWLDGNRLRFHDFSVAAAIGVIGFESLVALATIVWLISGRHQKWQAPAEKAAFVDDK